MKCKIIAILFFATVSTSFSQQKISGTVTDNTGVPLPGVNLIFSNNNKGTTTDFDGKFVINANFGDVITVSYTGFTTKTFKVKTGVLVYNIILKESQKQLEEVLVVGYGTKKKSILTGSVSSVSGKLLTSEPVPNATQALQGKAAGVQVIASDAPGQGSSVIIRGLGTLQSGRNPLYVVDGVLTNDINNLNSFDITSINVLKDAASLAIYGNRGANGVIIITTRKGSKGVVRINFDTYTGFRNILRKVPMANATQYVTYSNEAIKRDLERDNNPSNDNDTSSFFSKNQNYDTNWLDAITQTGLISNYNLSLSAGSEKVQSFFSLGFIDEQGILKEHRFKRLTLRNNLNYKINDKLKFSHNVSAQLNWETPQSFAGFTTAYKQAPIVPEKDDKGRFGSSVAFNNVGNPTTTRHFFEEKQRFLRLQGAFKLDYEVLKHLVFTSRFSFESTNGRVQNFQNRLGNFLASNPTNKEKDFEGGILNPAKTRLSVTSSNSYRWFIDNYVTYEKTFDDIHNVNLTLGITAEEQGSSYQTATRNNVPLARHLRFNLNNGDEDNTQRGSGTNAVTNKLYSYIARVNYDYKGKYLFNASFRRDGSSKFKKGSRYGNFYAISGGWVVSKERFMEDGVFDLLKIRTSYGELGNQNVAFNTVNATTGSGGFYPFGPNQNLQQGTTVAGVVQQDLTWEVTDEFNIGLEYAFLGNKLTGELDYYIRTNTNATLKMKLPDVFGFAPFNAHIGEVVNSGVELMLHWNSEISKNFNYGFGINFAYNHNELTKVNNRFFQQERGGFINNGQYTKRIAVGQPLGSFYLYELDGIDDKGEFVYKDHNGNGKIDEGDRCFFGSYVPKYTMGFNIKANYKNFDFLLDFFGNFGNVVYNGKKAQRFGKENIELSVFDKRWTSKSPSTKGSRAFNDVPLSSNYYLESGDFLRLNNVSIGYSLPDNFTHLFSKMRLYVTAKNPLIFQSFSGFTPELPGDGNPQGSAGVELDAYPTLSSYYIGLNFAF